MRKITIVSILIFQIFAIRAQETWNLSKCIKYAYDNNIEIRRIDLSAKVSENALKQSKYDLLPSVSGRASWSQNYGRSVDYVTNGYTTQNSNSINYGIGANVNLFSGFRKKKIIEQNTINLQAALMEIDKLKEDMALNITSYYLNILFSIEQLNVAKDNLQLSENQLKRVKILVDVGKKPQSDLLHQKSQVAKNRSAVISGENALSLAYLDLYQILEIKGDSTFEIEIPTIDIQQDADAELLEYESKFESIIAERPSFKLQDLRIASAAKQLDIAKADYYPSLSFNANIGSGYSNLRYDMIPNPSGMGFIKDGVMSFGDQYRVNLSKSFGFSLSIPIFSKFRVRTNVQNANIRYEDAKLQKALSYNNLYKQLQTAYTKAVAAVNNYRAEKQSVASFEEAFKYAKTNYELGKINSYDYNQAQSNLIQARSALIRAKFEYVFRTKILEYYSGKELVIE